MAVLYVCLRARFSIAWARKYTVEDQRPNSSTPTCKNQATSSWAMRRDATQPLTGHLAWEDARKA